MKKLLVVWRERSQRKRNLKKVGFCSCITMVVWWRKISAALLNMVAMKAVFFISTFCRLMVLLGPHPLKIVWLSILKNLKGILLLLTFTSCLKGPCKKSQSFKFNNVILRLKLWFELEHTTNWFGILVVNFFDFWFDKYFSWMFIFLKPIA